MSKFLNFFIILLLVCCSWVISAPQPQPSVSGSLVAETDDLEASVVSVAVKDAETDLEGASSFGHGYYSSPYIGGYYGGLGGHYPYYGSYGGYGLGGGYYGLGYPYYGGYYGHHGVHGHYF